MKAVCVNAARKLDVRDIPEPGTPPPGHLLVTVESAAINHGDKSFLANPGAAGAGGIHRADDVWGSSASGTVRAVGADLPSTLVGRAVAVYRSLSRSEHTVGLWSEQALVPRTSCVVLPQTVSARDYSGSLVNAVTAHAFLEQAEAESHKGVLVTAGGAATGLAMAALARKRGMPAIFLTRSAHAAESLQSLGLKHVLNTGDERFEGDLRGLAAELNATAVFDGIGGELTSRIAPLLPMNSTIYLYGFLGAAVPITIAARVIMAGNLMVRRFSNFASTTVTEPRKLAAAITYLESVIDDPLFRTRIGKEFPLDEIDAALAYEAAPGAKAVLVPGGP